MKIKTFILILALAAPICNINAQEPKHEISVSYGVLPNSLWLDGVQSFFEALFGQKKNTRNYVGPIGLEYHYRVSPLIGVGAVAVYSHHEEDLLKDDAVIRSRNKNYYTIMPSVKFNWLRRDHWGLYSKVAIGASLFNQKMKEAETGQKTDENKVNFNFQASAIGVEVGSGTIYGFFEAGLGEQGVFLGGVRAKF